MSAPNEYNESRIEQQLSYLMNGSGVLPDPKSRIEQQIDHIINNGTATEQEIVATLPNKANLVGGKVPSSELPSYIDETTEGYYYDGAFYEDEVHTTPITPSGSIIYVDIPTRRTYRWTGTGYLMIDDENALYVVPAVNMTTMGELRAYIDGINEQGLHVLLDFHNYIGDAFVCTVHMFDEGGVHYCEMLDAVNIQSVVKASYVDADTIADFVSAGKSKLVTQAWLNANTETWTFTLADSTTVTKKVVVLP